MFDSKNPWSKMAYFKHGNGFKCLILGHQGRLGGNPIAALHAATELGANPHAICILHTASGSADPGFKLIKRPDYKNPVEAEGVFLEERYSAAIMQTTDCPTIILTNNESGKMVVTHAGRPALTPKGHCVNCTIVETALSHIGTRDFSKVSAYVVGDICGKCFKHDHASARPLVAPFLPLGEDVFFELESGSLSLFAVIKHRLTHAGVPETQIGHYGDCTFEKSWYASHRRDNNRNDRNHIIVVKTR